MAKSKKSKAVAEFISPTLADVARGYLASLDADGAGLGTLCSYKIELHTALRTLGEMTPLAELTPAKVQAFFDGAAVTRTRFGTPKAKSSIAKTRRVFRLALLWSQDAKLVEIAPLPSVPAPASIVVVPESL